MFILFNFLLKKKFNDVSRDIKGKRYPLGMTLGAFGGANLGYYKHLNRSVKSNAKAANMFLMSFQTVYLLYYFGCQTFKL